MGAPPVPWADEGLAVHLPPGLFDLLYGVARFLGSAAMGILYDVSVPALVACSVLVELPAIPLIVLVHRSRLRADQSAVTSSIGRPPRSE